MPAGRRGPGSGYDAPGRRTRRAAIDRLEALAMLRHITDMPAGTLGFEAVGDVDDDDWEDAVEPVLRREIAAGEKLRLLYLLGAEAHDVEGDAMKKDTGFRARHSKSFERVAVVTDEDWMKPALRALSFMMPGSARGFAVQDLPAAKAWLSEDMGRSG